MPRCPLILSPGLASGQFPKPIPIPLHFGSVLMCDFLLPIMLGKQSFRYVSGLLTFSGSLTQALFLNTTIP